MSWNVKYGAKNDGPKVQNFDGPNAKEDAEAYATAVGGKVTEVKPKPAPVAKTPAAKTPPPAK